MNQKITVYTDQKAIPHISLTESMLAWRRHYGIKEFKTLEPPTDNGICTVCKGDGVVKDANLGFLRCICSVKKEEHFMRVHWNPVRSMHQPKKLSDIKVWGSKKSQDSLSKMLDVATEFMNFPTKWLTIAGDPGSGKSHVLQAFAESFGPWAIYVTDTEFEGLVHSALGENGALDRVLEPFKRTPILLYDDWGAGHGAKFGVSMLTRVIDFRYNMWREYLTVMTTNLEPDALIRISPRVADRIRDRERVTYVGLNGVLSWRTAKNET